ncbi:HAD-IIB family hydrolase [Patescibacteria group bacterium]|nr:HAD-IIB family hydrolase [Patescibacteria group bacterium]MBU4057411.1 HAD-IIB family hydrolase [Patescibacteria group bacterium]MBU4115957.1 HAD-IIB family hydrolase [Patescibacteria group bacterium]
MIMDELNKNKPLEKLDPDFIRKNIKAVTFDIDGVIIPTGTFLRESVDSTELIVRTHKLSREMIEMIKELKKYVWINFSSGRALLYLEHMLEDILWDKVSLIAENGNFILLDGKIEQLSLYEQSYFQKITDIRNDIKKLKEEKPDSIYGFEPKHIIITVHTAKKIPEVEEIVKKHDRENELYCLWTNEGYDIGYKKINKRTALEYLAGKLKIKPEEMITIGNNLNDKEMLDFGIGISVDPEQVSGEYAIPKKKGELGGEILAEYLLGAMRR